MRTSVLSHSSIWDPAEIVALNESKLKTYEVNKLRSNLFIPGSDLSESLQTYSKVPILLIQNAAKSGLGRFAGWDIIMPHSWSMSFWLPLVHMGARAIGQNELNYLLFETGESN